MFTALYSDISKDTSTPSWDVVVRDDNYVKRLLERGECNGLLPDFWMETGDYFAALTMDDYSSHAAILARWLRAQNELQGITWAIERLARMGSLRAKHGTLRYTGHLCRWQN